MGLKIMSFYKQFLLGITLGITVICCSHPTWGFAELPVAGHERTHNKQQEQEKKQRKQEQKQFKKRIEEKIKVIVRTPLSKREKLQEIITETQDLINEYNAKFKKPFVTKKDFRENFQEKIQAFQAKHVDDPRLLSSKKAIKKLQKKISEIIPEEPEE